MNKLITETDHDFIYSGGNLSYYTCSKCGLQVYEDRQGLAVSAWSPWFFFEHFADEIMDGTLLKKWSCAKTVMLQALE